MAQNGRIGPIHIWKYSSLSSESLSTGRNLYQTGSGFYKPVLRYDYVNGNFYDASSSLLLSASGDLYYTGSKIISTGILSKSQVEGYTLFSSSVISWSGSDAITSASYANTSQSYSPYYKGYTTPGSTPNVLLYHDVYDGLGLFVSKSVALTSTGSMWYDGKQILSTGSFTESALNNYTVMTQSIADLTSSYANTSASILALTSSYGSLTSSMALTSLSYALLTTSLTPLSTSYALVTNSYALTSQSYAPTSVSYALLSASERLVSSSYINQSSSYSPYLKAGGTSAPVPLLYIDIYDGAGLFISKSIVLTSTGSLWYNGYQILSTGSFTESALNNYTVMTQSIVDLTGSYSNTSASFIALTSSYANTSASFKTLTGSYANTSASVQNIITSLTSSSITNKSVNATVANTGVGITNLEWSTNSTTFDANSVGYVSTFTKKENQTKVFAEALVKIANVANTATIQIEVLKYDAGSWTSVGTATTTTTSTTYVQKSFTGTTGIDISAVPDDTMLQVQISIKTDSAAQVASLLATTYTIATAVPPPV